MNMYGSAGASPLMIVASVPLFNIFAVLILTIHGDGGGFHPAQLKKALLGVCKNPILWGILVGLVFSVAGWQFPTLIDKTLGYFADMSTPIALSLIHICCEEVLSYLDTCRADLESRTADVPDEEKKSAYTGAVTFNGRHGFAFTYVNFPPFAAIHANNVADVFLESATGEAAQEAQQNCTAYVGQNGFEVDLEQILAWDPDIIFLDPGNMDLVNEEYAKNPGFFESLRAVQEGELYTCLLYTSRCV